MVYTVQRLEPPGGSWPAQPVQLWTLRYEQGMLREELLLDLSPSAIEGRIEPPSPYIGYNWVSDLSASPDGRYIALTLQAWEGGGANTLIIQAGSGEVYQPIMPGNFGVGFLAWIPGSERVIVADGDRIMWGTMTFKGEDYTPFPIYDMLDVAVSPDGRKTIFSAIPTVHAKGMYLGSLDVDGSNLTPFNVPSPLPGFQVQDLALSPDGRTCVLVWWGGETFRGAGQLWVMDADGSNQRALGAEDMYAFAPTWSPDGKTLAFLRQENHQTRIADSNPLTWSALVTSLWLIDLEGNERLLLSSEGRYAHWDPEWLPDGSGLIFVSNRGGENNLWFIRADGTGLQQLTRQGGVSPEVAVMHR
ncbi:MAG: hypothetical protein ACP5ME_14030 [Anaerolineae bacterium]